MSDVCRDTYEKTMKQTRKIEDDNCAVGEPSLKVLQLVSIFESDESDAKLKREFLL